MANSLSFCRICKDNNLNKYRRLIFGKSFTVSEQLAEVLRCQPKENDGNSPFVCQMCFNKLNKLYKIDFELKHKVDQLKIEKSEILSNLRANVIVNTVDVAPVNTPVKAVEAAWPETEYVHADSNVQTPKRSHTSKRLILHSPTPRKAKKCLLKICSPHRICKPPSGTKKRLNVDLSPGKAKVSFRGRQDHKVRTRIIKDGVWQSVVKSIVRGDKGPSISRKLYSIESLKPGLQRCVLKELEDQCKTLCQVKNKSVLRNISPKNLESLSFKSIINDCQLYAPLLLETLACVMNQPTENKLAVAVALLLRNRNTHMSAVHHVIGQILDHGGATDEVIKLLSIMGLCIGPQSMGLKRNEFEISQRQKIKHIVQDHVKQCQMEYMTQKVKKSLEALPESDTIISDKYQTTIPPVVLPQSLTTTVYQTGMSFVHCPASYSVAGSYEDCLVQANCYSIPKYPATTGLSALPLKTQDKTLAIEFPAVSPLFCIQPKTDPCYAQAENKKTQTLSLNFISKHSSFLAQSIPRFEVIGDNLDLTISPTSMTKERQRKSIHWFLNIALCKRVLSDLPDECPKAEIMKVPNSVFIPNTGDCQALENDMIYHIIKILCKHVKCLKQFQASIPDCIQHPYMDEMCKKSEYRIIDLLDKSENKSEDMISILQHIHKDCVAHSEENPTKVIEKIVFGGDVLTNERAYSAQLAMMNAECDFNGLAGVVHRPEGLHRMMNFLGIIYKQFYSLKSAADQGSLYQLRNVVRRVDVQGPEGVTSSYRSHMNFVQDCLDSFVLGACLHMFGMDSLDGVPVNVEIPHFLHLASIEEQYAWLKKLGEQLFKTYIKLNEDSLINIQMTDQVSEMDDQELLLAEMYDSRINRYSCTCNKTYKTKGHFKRHLEKEHEWDFALNQDTTNSAMHSKEDHVAVWRASFMKLSLLLRDTEDAYQYGDGDRIFRNAKFEMLCADAAHHTKYRLWLWRMQAYETAILSPRQAVEYKWNCTANTHGGKGKNIPNDNLVETLVQKIKKKLREQGSNITHNSAQRIALSIQIQQELKENILRHFTSKEKGRSKPTVNRDSELNLLMTELLDGEVFDVIQGREFHAFRGFSDIFSRVKAEELHKWISDQKFRASYEMF